MAGIEESKELLVFVARLASAIGVALEDGKIGLLDMARIAPVLLRAGDALEGIEKLPMELSDLDAAEREELLQAFKDELSLPQEKVEAMAERCLVVVAKLHEIYLLLKK